MPDLKSKIVLRFRGHAAIFTAAASHPRSFSAVEDFNGARISPQASRGPIAASIRGRITSSTLWRSKTDGKILVGGSFFHLGGGGTGTTSRNFIEQLNSDGSLDTDFDPGAGGIVYAIAVQADGRIVLGGAFITLGGGGAGTTRFYIGRLNSDGSVDDSFNPGASDYVLAIALQADGGILVSGNFTTLGGGGIGTTPRNHIGRLDSNGTVDVTFDPGLSGVAGALVVQSDGKILVGGIFGFLGGGGSGTTARNNIGRLNPDGTLDANFDPGANNTVSKLIVQPDGRIFVGGDFTALGGGSIGTTTRNHLGRLGTTAPPATKPLNISTRMQVLTDDNVLIGGFIVTGISPKKVIVRAIGPSLTAFGVQGALSDPTLDLNSPDGSVTSNDDWKESQLAEIEATGLQPTDDAESAILQTLVPGAYTAIVHVEQTAPRASGWWKPTISTSRPTPSWPISAPAVSSTPATTS